MPNKAASPLPREVCSQSRPSSARLRPKSYSQFQMAHPPGLRTSLPFWLLKTQPRVPFAVLQHQRRLCEMPEDFLTSSRGAFKVHDGANVIRQCLAPGCHEASHVRLRRGFVGQVVSHFKRAYTDLPPLLLQEVYSTP